LYEQGTGTTFKTITKDHLAKIVVPILPLNTQKAIGDFLAWLDSHTNKSPDFSFAPELPEFLRPKLATIQKIETLSVRISEAQSLREESNEEVDKYSASMANKVFTELAEKYR